MASFDYLEIWFYIQHFRYCTPLLICRVENGQLSVAVLLKYPLVYSWFCDRFACYSIMSSAGLSRTSSAPGTPRRSNVKYVSAAALNLERVYEQNRARLQQRDGALSPTNEQAFANAGKGKPRLLLMGQRRYSFRKGGSSEGGESD